MKKLSCIILLGSCGAMALAGCSPIKSLVRPIASVVNIPGLSGPPLYSGPKARITVADFEIKTIKANKEVGLGLREMFINALINSNRFSIVEQQALNTAVQSQEPPVSGIASLQTMGLIIAVAVTEFEPEISGGRDGVGGGGGAGSGVLGGLLGSAFNKAYLALEVRFVDASTSDLLSTKVVQAQAQTMGTASVGLSNSLVLSKGLSIYVRTPMEKAIRNCITEAVRYITQAIPQRYYNIKDGKTKT